MGSRGWISSSGPQGNETTTSFPEGIESPGVTPGNTLDASAFQTTISSMSSLPTLHLSETFANMATHGEETVESMSDADKKPESLLAVPMFDSSMPTLPRISDGSQYSSDPDGMGAAHEASMTHGGHSWSTRTG